MAAKDFPEPPLQLVGRIVDDVRDLFREEVALARAEVRQELVAWSASAIALGGGAIAAVAGVLLVLLAAAQAAVSWLGWPAWAGYLTLGALLAVGGAAASASAVKRGRRVTILPRTANIRTTSRWVGRQTH